MAGGEARWAEMVNLRPDQLQEIVDAAPVAYWPLGLIEHHGWSLPVGFDGFSAQRHCLAMVKRTGGVVLPVMWWGGAGGHGGFKWTFYQPMEAAEAIFETTIRRLIDFGFRCIVPIPGHGPWSRIIEKVLPPIAEEHADVLAVGAPGTPHRPADMRFHGDHAARWETAYGLALFPELIDMGALDDERDAAKVWPLSGPPPEDERMDIVNFDESDPCFAQAGDDSRRASAEEVTAEIEAMHDHIVGMIERHLGWE